MEDINDTIAVMETQFDRLSTLPVRVLQKLGFLSLCCAAKTEYNNSYDFMSCQECGVKV